ncbi:MAG: hypothetical protein IJU91_06505 [Selenomonadaceae bacterium]|nr:hypothetical protein [Selenomonadaceae bacterium]
MREKVLKAGISTAFEICEEMTGAEEVESAGNSFFDRSYFGTRVLILAPRAGDEIAVAGNMILNFTAAKAEVFIAYSNFSAWNEELECAMKILNVPREKVIFLALKNLKADLKKILLNLRANIIFYPVDSENLSAAFEEALSEILNSTYDYRPEVYQKFALATAVNAAPDFYAPNLFSVRRPKVGVTDDYNFDVIDRANFSWQNRVRFPVSESCRKTVLKNNPLAAALNAYKSRRAELSPLKILNSDEVFFERRTDNQLYHAKISVGENFLSDADKNLSDAERVRDFKIFGAENFTWRPAGGNLIIDFDEEVQVRRIVIYGNALNEDSAEIILRFQCYKFYRGIDKAGDYIDNTNEIKMKLPARGQPCVYDVEKIFVKRAEIIPVNAGKNFGIAEIEFFANAEPLRKISPFIKLCIGKDFFYKYFVPDEIEKIPIGLYRFHIDEPVKICAEVNGENILTEVLTEDEEIILNLSDAKEVVLTAEVVGNANIYDRTIIKRVGDLAQIQLKVWQWIDKISGK